MAKAQVTTLALELPQKPSSTSVRSESGPGAQAQRWREEALAYEHGEGVPRDPVRAAQLYCLAARNGDGDAQYNLAWMLVNGRGIERDDAQAAHLFAAAAEHGIAQAGNMLVTLGVPHGPPPDCLRPPDTVQAASASVANLGPALSPPANAPQRIVRFVNLVAPEYQLAPDLVLAVIAAESNFDPLAVSPKNARGLMQLVPGTAARFKVRHVTDPAQNIRGGMAYLRWLMAYFRGDLKFVLAAYNAGEKTVEHYRGVPPYPETRLYVQRVLAAIGGPSSHPFDPTITAPSDALARLGESAGMR